MNPATPSSDFPRNSAFDEIRFRCPDRSAPVDPRTIDSLLPPDHLARFFWEVVCSLDLSVLLEPYKARLYHPGRPPIDVRILVTLWLFANHEGVLIARKLFRLCYRDDVYRWIRGGVDVNYHTLSDFHVQHGDWLRKQAITATAELHHKGLVLLDHIGQDGLRVRAWAGSDSFKTADVLRANLDEARTRLNQLEEADRKAAVLRGERRRTKSEAAQLRGARDRWQRLTRALQECEQSAPTREQRKKGDGVKTRISGTDPEARKMKMPDGGYRLAYNVQLATDLDSLVPVGMDVVNAGNDAGQSIPMRQEVESDYGKTPKEWYADGSYATREEIEAMAEAGIVIYTPIKAEEKQRARGDDPSQRKKGESDEVAQWRERMSTKEGKTEYRKRGMTELINAEARRHGLYQVTVRGLDKVKVVVWWYVWMMVLLRGRRLQQAPVTEVEQQEQPGEKPVEQGAGVMEAGESQAGPETPREDSS